MRASGYLYEIAIGNVILPLQFIVRGYQIYHFQKKFKMLGKWAKSAFYFFMYIIAGHVSLSLHCDRSRTGSKEQKNLSQSVDRFKKIFHKRQRQSLLFFGTLPPNKKTAPARHWDTKIIEQIIRNLEFLLGGCYLYILQINLHILFNFYFCSLELFINTDLKVCMKN